jgi:hypothetical protein
MGGADGMKSIDEERKKNVLTSENLNENPKNLDGNPNI